MEPRLKVVKLQVVATFHLIDEGGTVLEEVANAPLTMFPGKFIEMKELVEKLELRANNEKADILQLINRPLL